MNTITIHPQPKKPLTFADIPCGTFIYEGISCVKLNSAAIPDDARNAVKVLNGVLIRVLPWEIVTLPDAPPQQDDTVRYGDLTPDEMFEDPDSSYVFMVSDQQSPHGHLWCQDLSDGRRAWFRGNYRVRRVHSVTITRDQQEGAKSS